MEFDLFKLVRKEMELVEQSLYQHVNTSEQVLSEASTHLIKAGGKRIRPGFALLVARMYRDEIGYAIPLATALELVHMATLVHDDVIDNSEVRRGTGTVKRLWGNRVAIYAGNFVFARALDLIASYNRQDILEVVADASM